MQSMRDLSERQSQLFLLISSFLLRYEPPELQTLVDDDVADAAAALAATFETAARGVIYEHRPSALPAERLATALKAAARGSRSARRDRRSNATRRSSCAESRRPRARSRASEPESPGVSRTTGPRADGRQEPDATRRTRRKPRLIVP